MAGIGWKLQRMIDHGSLAGTIAAYLTGVAVTSAPWLLTTAVLTSLRLVSPPRDRRLRGRRALPDRRLRGDGRAVGAGARRRVALHRRSPLRSPHRSDRGAAAARGGADAWSGSRWSASALVLVLRLPLALALVGAPLTAVIGAQWLMLSVGGGMMSPVVLLRAFGVGAPLSLIAALVRRARGARRRRRLPVRLRGRPAGDAGAAGARRRARAARRRRRERAAAGRPSSSTGCSRCRRSRTTCRSGPTRSSSTW